MKTKGQLLKAALRSETDFRLAVVELLADTRNSIITAILLDEIEREPFLQKAVKEMRRLLSKESKE